MRMETMIAKNDCFSTPMRKDERAGACLHWVLLEARMRGEFHGKGLHAVLRDFLPSPSVAVHHTKEGYVPPTGEWIPVQAPTAKA